MESLSRLCKEVSWIAETDPDGPAEAGLVERYNAKHEEYRQFFLDHEFIGIEPVKGTISNEQLLLRCERLRNAAETVWAMNPPQRPVPNRQSPPSDDGSPKRDR